MTTEPMPIAEVRQADRILFIRLGLNKIASNQHVINGEMDHSPDMINIARHRLTALADAERKLEDMCASLECAAGCDEGVTEDQAYSEILSWGGSAVASSYASARTFLAAQDGDNK